MLVRLANTEVLGECPVAEKEYLSKNTPLLSYWLIGRHPQKL